MMSNYLICEEERNAFTFNASAVIDGKVYRFPIKIDTGCTHSVLPFRIIANVTRRESYRLKKKDIRENVPYMRSYGVSDKDFVKTCDRLRMKWKFLTGCTSLKFLHKDLPIQLNDFAVTSDIYINYDRTNKPLMGIDMLKKFVFVCDVSKVTGKYTFIGCPILQKDKTDFYRALLNHFGYTNAMNM